jgi:hypothetical protein
LNFSLLLLRVGRGELGLADPCKEPRSCSSPDDALVVLFSGPAATALFRLALIRASISARDSWTGGGANIVGIFGGTVESL